MKKRFISTTFLLTSVMVLIIGASLSSSAQGISTSNTARYIGNGRWEWTVFINPNSRAISKINCIEYTLHPTFPTPVQTTCKLGNNRQPFSLTATGWGEFLIHIRVFLKDGRIVDGTHCLQFAEHGYCSP
jgi:transcription initiation factor IIF auxiliary subunit